MKVNAYATSPAASARIVNPPETTDSFATTLYILGRSTVINRRALPFAARALLLDAPYAREITHTLDVRSKKRGIAPIFQSKLHSVRLRRWRGA